MPPSSPPIRHDETAREDASRDDKFTWLPQDITVIPGPHPEPDVDLEDEGDLEGEDEPSPNDELDEE